MTDRESQMYDYVVESGVATSNELNLAFNLVGGGWEEVINRVVYVRTGYRTLDQYIECEMEDEEEEIPLQVGVYTEQNIPVGIMSEVDADLYVAIHGGYYK